ncbi:hypothetical protein RCG47_05640 [Staphylococcus simulans]|uniref:Phage protein n=3 Tax=Staphylococcus TaxID=1279 RepID=A0ABP2YRB9_STASI|nr:hypothetical protein [Staphylococcus simulans]ERS92668.1 hypothetical protein SSIM_10945 [Staphylococcus simulans UMC-CNS-990]MCE5023495.1 hypothetical protein [Staphylococcus simulans]MCE5148566.1 hypothetical protein [Staphylococcus simulans]MDQ7114498.1 hypothetical protein [Staphylococcus simulans]MDQ7140509.1 hypothetical protein [Staphylococcus simulans]
MEKIKEFYLVEVNKYGEESPLMQNYSNGFVRGASPANAYRFTDEEQVKQVCAMQNMLAGIFKNGAKTYYVRQDITRSSFDEKGEPYVEEREDESDSLGVL